MSNNLVVYKPNDRLKTNVFTTWVIMFRNMWKSRELIIQLFKRDFFMSYKKSFLGWGWIFLAPIMGIISWVFMNQTGVLAPGDVGIPYPVYVLLGSSIWGLFMGFYSSSTNTLNAASGFIMQVNYPHEALLIKENLQQLANFGINLMINLIVFALFGVIPTWGIIVFPFMLIPLMLLGAAIGLVVGLIAVVATDISKAVNTFMGFLIYLTPIIYSKDVDNDLLQSVIKWNPLTYLVTAPRDMLLYAKFDSPEPYALTVLISIVLFLISLRLFYVAEKMAVEKMI